MYYEKKMKNLTEMNQHFQTLDNFNKKIFLINFFDDIRYKLDCVFLSPSFKHKKENLEKIKKCHNKMAERVNTYENKCFNEIGSLDVLEIIWFKKYHLRERDYFRWRFSTLYIEPASNEFKEFCDMYGGFGHLYGIEDFNAEANIRDYFDLL
jgi:hypothetical protein